MLGGLAIYHPVANFYRAMLAQSAVMRQ